MPTRPRLKAETMPPAMKPADEWIGYVIDGRYRLDALIAEGGMGRVFRAHHLRLDREVAVKLLHPATSPVPDGEKRFEREAKAVARLDHSNCVSVQDYGQLDDGSLFLVMPFLEGIVLSEAINNRAMSIDHALRITRHILDGIAHAHQAGIVHRDIKPDNIILVDHEGIAYFPMILDFGIAKIIGCGGGENADSNLTQVGQRFGTPKYMSPEQVTSTTADLRSDLYSLSVVLFEMLTGSPPYVGDSEKLMLMHVTDPIPTLSDRAPGTTTFPDRLENLVVKGLAKNPEDRYQSAEEYSCAIDAYLEQAGTGDSVAIAPTEAISLQPRPKSSTSLPPSATQWKFRFKVAGVAIALLTIVYMLIRTGDSDENYAAHAKSLLDEGKPAAALAYLEKHRDDIRNDSEATLWLGHTQSAMRAYPEALIAYQRAYGQDSESGDDRVLRANTLLMLDDERGETAVLAAEFLVKTLHDTSAQDRIVELASGHQNFKHRTEMRQLAEQFEIDGDINRVRSYQLDLLQEESCERRLSVVAKLRSLGKANAIGPLKRARKRKNNSCLRDAATDAIRYLESLRR